MQTPTYKKLLAWLPAITLMILIFALSAQEADVSSAKSSHLLDTIIHVIEKLTGITIEPHSDFYEILHTILRKLGHFSEFAALGCSITLPLRIQGMRGWKLFAASEILTAIYAATDEFHQLFVPGRDGNPLDVCIDSMGACVGILIGMLLLYLFYSKHLPEHSAES